MRYLPPMIFTQKYYVGIEAQIMAALDKLIYDPIRQLLKGTAIEIQNATASPLMQALVRGTVYYQNGEFKGLFNAKISKEIRDLGGVWNIRTRTFTISQSRLPAQITSAITQAESYYTRINRDIIGIIDDVDLSKLPLFQYGETINAINHDFEQTIKSVTIAPVMTAGAKKVIDEEWAKNLDLYVKGWAEESILKMRQQVLQNTLDGHRAGNLVRLLQDNYNATKTKAKFLARQETSLLMSKMREQRYAGIGITRYKWSTSHDGDRVRKMHQALDGKIFSFNSPPVSAPNGARNNPGEDFGCRCTAIPVLESA